VTSNDNDDLPTQVDTLIGQHLSDHAEDDLSGQDLGPFRIRRKLGQGGMGQVYLARQMDPIERDVALKLILRKVQNARALARFEIEQQALAQMSHPGIAQVFDAGTTPTGFPYFAMEFVDGEPLDHYCQRHRLNLSGRIKLLIQICNAVQHAHQRGIIHRDLKPSNILVTTIDGEPRPKVIDFGIARASQNEDPDDGDDAARDIIGTPQYMSPEQFNLDHDTTALDLRSDVYSLGVVLHELLVACPPIQGDRLSNADDQTLSNVFAEYDPLPAPSSRLGEDAKTDQALAEQRQTSVRRLRQRLKTDLDAITLKALNQDREQRYSSAQALADDLDRVLDHYPVSAVPNTAGYRTRRFVQRNKLAVGSASAIALALIGGLTAATLGMLEAQHQFELAEQRKNDLEQVSGFQQAMLEDLDPQSMGLSMLNGLREQYAASLTNLEPDENESRMAALELVLQTINATDISRQVVDDQLLAQARDSITQQFVGQPLLQADLLESIAAVYLAIGRASPALELRREVLALRQAHLPANNLAVLEARSAYGYAYFENDEFEAAEETIQALMNDIDISDPEASLIYLRARNDMALVLVDQGRIDEALALTENPPAFAENLEDDDSEIKIASTANRGYVLARAGQIDNALVEFRNMFELSRRLRGPDAPSTLRAMINISAALGATGRHAEALDIESDLLDRMVATVGREHISSIRIMSNMANNLRRVGREDEAMEMLIEARSISTAVLGPLSPVTLRIRLNLASLMTHLGQLEAGYAMLEALVQDRAMALGPGHPDTLTAMEVQASNLQKQQRHEDALTLIEQVIEGRAAAFGQDHRLVNQSRWMRAIIQRDMGQMDAALPTLHRLAENSFERAPRDNQTLSRAVDLYDTLLRADQNSAATEWFEKTLAWLENSDPESLDNRQRALRMQLQELPSR